MLTKPIKKFIKFMEEKRNKDSEESTPVNLNNKDYIFVDRFLFKSEDSY